MGLFADASKYGGTFYREFSQAQGSNDVSNYFGYRDAFVTNYGVCSGASLYWLKFYLTRAYPYAKYNNNYLLYEKENIVTAQKAVRYREQPLNELLIDCGLQKDVLWDDMVNQENMNEIIDIIIDRTCAWTLTYKHPQFGQHVVCGITDIVKNLYFCDVHKGDVFFPRGFKGKDWLLKYFDIFIKQCGNMGISSFKHRWNSGKFNSELKKIRRDACYYIPPNGRYLFKEYTTIQ